MRLLVAIVLLVSLVATGCGANADDETIGSLGSEVVDLDTDGSVIDPTLDESDERAEEEAPTVEAAIPVTSGESDVEGLPPPEPEPAIAEVDGSYIIRWDALASRPYFAPPSGIADPFYHLHTNPELDGFFLSFELYTEWGEAWTGQTGTFDISCSEPVNSSGICPYFDADGPGPGPVIGDDFATRGSLTIRRLDPGGYDITVHELIFGDGTSLAEFTMVG